MTTGTPAAVTFERVTKRFPGALALEDVSFPVAAGSCHALCGENGAGKSTLGKILAGIHRPDEGRVLVLGNRVDFHGPEQALAAGIGIVHQELAFCDNLSVAENLCLGSLPARGTFLSRREMWRRAEERLAATGAEIDVRRTVRELTIGQQQVVQIAAAIGSGARVIVFDEPTSSLSQHEAEKLYELIARIRGQGVTAIYVSHRMEEIFRLCDTVTVLRDGRHVATEPIGSLDRATLVQLMIGRRLDEYFPAHVQAKPGEELLRVEGLSSPPAFTDISFTLRAGEVLGFAGLVGAGRSEIAQALFGLDPHAAGQDSRRRPRGPDPHAAPGDARGHRPRPGGSQTAGAGAVDDGARATRRLPRCGRSPACPSSAIGLNARSRAPTSIACASAPRAPTRPPPASPAATSRSSCSRNGWRRSAGF